jgi:hypothetical protein
MCVAEPFGRLGLIAPAAPPAHVRVGSLTSTVASLRPSVVAVRAVRPNACDDAREADEPCGIGLKQRDLVHRVRRGGDVGLQCNVSMSEETELPE